MEDFLPLSILAKTNDFDPQQLFVSDSSYGYHDPNRDIHNLLQPNPTSTGEGLPAVSDAISNAHAFDLNWQLATNSTHGGHHERAFGTELDRSFSSQSAGAQTGHVLTTSTGFSFSLDHIPKQFTLPMFLAMKNRIIELEQTCLMLQASPSVDDAQRDMYFPHDLNMARHSKMYDDAMTFSAGMPSQSASVYEQEPSLRPEKRPRTQPPDHISDSPSTSQRRQTGWPENLTPLSSPNTGNQDELTSSEFGQREPPSLIRVNANSDFDQTSVSSNAIWHIDSSEHVINLNTPWTHNSNFSPSVTTTSTPSGISSEPDIKPDTRKDRKKSITKLTKFIRVQAKEDLRTGTPTMHMVKTMGKGETSGSQAYKVPRNSVITYDPWKSSKTQAGGAPPTTPNSGTTLLLKDEFKRVNVLK